ncbi:hypothetical protein BT63DRAFT_424134 [Microthyrium microscopicum]|uniref:DUF7053 domain-containing protein n=1 Tax=Microthyrium microscopicum TaxID=703497 RepID=A0A6A6UFC1_9PEZI|nr:hypothetical protein BT63DRAFT_424134 [Microthyrium microscopicum]
MFFSTTAHLHHRTLLPPTATLADANTVFANHDTLLHLDPEIVSYTSIDAPPTSAAEHTNAETNWYQVTDHMAGLPAGLWDTTIKYNISITPIENGIRRHVSATLGLEQESTWVVEEASAADLEREVAVDGEGKGKRLVLVEDIYITASRVLMGTVKGKCESAYPGIHAKWMQHVVEAGKETTSGKTEQVVV